MALQPTRTSRSTVRIQSRAWVFTLNNPTGPITPNPNVKILLYAPEIGSNGNPHFQGYVELKNSLPLSTLKAWMPSAHFEKRMGTAFEAASYCCKTFLEKGLVTTNGSNSQSHSECSDATTNLSSSQASTTPSVAGVSKPIIYGFAGSWEDYLESIRPKSKQSQRERLEILKSAIDQGKSEVELANIDFEIWVKHHKALGAYRTLIAPPRNHEMTVIIMVGPTGCGKSRFCHEQYPGAFWKCPKSQWWDGYDGQPVVVIDEYYGWLPYSYLLRLLDRYDLRVEIKGGYRSFTSNTIIITSNTPPKSWYRSFTLDALYRRITCWMVYNNDGTWDRRSSYPSEYDQYHVSENMSNPNEAFSKHFKPIRS